MQFYKKYIIPILLSLTILFGSTITLGQIQNQYLHMEDLENTQDQTEVNLEQEKQVYKDRIQERIELTDDALYMLETQIITAEDKMEEEFKETVDRFETSLKLYRSNLIAKKHYIDQQTSEEWEIFKARTQNWWGEVESELSETIDQVQDEFEDQMY